MHTKVAKKQSRTPAPENCNTPVAVISLDKIICQLNRAQMTSQNSNKDMRASPHEDAVFALNNAKLESEESDVSVHCSLDNSDAEEESNKYPLLVNQPHFSSRQAVLTSIPELPSNKRMKSSHHSAQVCLMN